MSGRPPVIHARADPTVLHCCKCNDKRNLPRPLRDQKDPRRNTADAVRAALRDGKVHCGNCRHEPCGRCVLLDASKRPIKQLGGANLLADRFDARGWRCAAAGCRHLNAVDATKPEFDGWDMLCAAPGHDAARPEWFSPLAAVVNAYGEDLAALRTDRLKLRDGPLREHLRDYARREGKRRVEEDQGPAAAPQAFGYKADGEYMVVLRFTSQSLRAFLAKMDRAWRAHLEYTAEKARETAQPPTQRAHFTVRPYQADEGATGAAASTVLSVLPRARRGQTAGRAPPAPQTAQQHPPLPVAGPYVPAAGWDDDDEGMYDDYPEDGATTAGTGQHTPGDEGPAYETPLTSYSSGSTYQTAGPGSCAATAASGQSTPAGSSVPAPSAYDAVASPDTVMTDAGGGGGGDDGSSFRPPTPQWSISSARSPEEVLQNYYDAASVAPQSMAHAGGGGSSDASSVYHTPAAAYGYQDHNYQDPGYGGYEEPVPEGGGGGEDKGKKGKSAGGSPESSKKDGKKKHKKK